MTMFDIANVYPRLPYHITFQIQVVYMMKTIFRMIVYEGASTCVMSLSCWRAIVSIKLSLSPTLLIMFDRHYFRPHGILPSFPIQLGGESYPSKLK